MTGFWRLMSLTLSFAFGLHGAYGETSTLALVDGATGAVGPYAEYLIDADNELSIKDVISKELFFSRINEAYPNFGSTEDTYWFRIRIDGSNYDSQTWFLIQSSQLAHTFQVFELKQGQISQVEALKGDREVIFQMQPDTDYVYIRANSWGNMLKFAVNWGSDQGFYQRLQGYNFFLGFINGGIFSLIAYYSILYYFIRDKSYLLYSYHLAMFVLIFLYLNGYLKALNLVDYTKDWPSVFLLLPLHSALLFVREFLQLRKESKLLYDTIGYISWFVLVLCLLSITVLSGPQTLIIKLIMDQIVIFIILYTAIYAVRKNIFLSKYFLFGWSIVLISASAHGLSTLTIIQANFFVMYGIQVAVLFEAICFALALAHKTRRFINERDSAMVAKRESEKFSNMLTYAIEKERKEISQEIHDGFNSALVAARYKAEAIERISTEERVKSIAKSLKDLMNDRYLNARIFVKRLRPENIDTLGLPKALKELIDTFEDEEFLIRYEVEGGLDFGNVTDETAIALYRILSEALTNARKYAKASECIIRLSASTPYEIKLTITDNGVGFDSSKHQEGTGLLSMQARARAVNGFCSIQSTTGEGTKIIVSLPR